MHMQHGMQCGRRQALRTLRVCLQELPGAGSEGVHGPRRPTGEGGPAAARLPTWKKGMLRSREVSLRQ